MALTYHEKGKGGRGSNSGQGGGGGGGRGSQSYSRQNFDDYDRKKPFGLFFHKNVLSIVIKIF